SLMLFFLVSCSSGAKSRLIGRWQVEDSKQDATVEFASDGTFVLGGNTSALPDLKVIKLFRDFNLKPGRNSLTYEVIDKDHLAIQADYTGLLEGLSAGKGAGSLSKDQIAKAHPKEVVSFTVIDNELTLSSENGKPVRFRRIN